jgi:hypothetical protein
MFRFIEDIPSPWWIRFFLVKLFRFLRKTKWGKNIVFLIKSRSHLGFVTKLHQKAIHDIRNLTVTQLFNDTNDEVIIEKLQNIVNSYRDVMADILEISEKELHCTIKIFADNGEVEMEKFEVYTLVRSDDEENYWHGRPLEFGSSHSHIVGKNSSFAALLGVSDRENDWTNNAYTCFVGNELGKYEKYDSSGLNWKNNYTSTAVFPIRYHFINEPDPNIIGFITFDAKTPVFGNSSIFDYNSPTDYYNDIKALSFFHVGGILADLLFPPLVMYKSTKGDN